MTVGIPTTYQDLLRAPVYAVLSTLMPDGQPQSTVIWCDNDGRNVFVNTMRGFRKEKNMRSDPRATVLAYRLDNPLRSVEVRGRVVEMTEVGALAHLDRLSEAYTGLTPYFGKCVPVELAKRETPVLCRIVPVHVVTLDAGKPCGKQPVGNPAVLGVDRGTIPASHADLLLKPIHGVLTTLMPDGQPQSSLVWCDYDGQHVRINTSRERQKGRNMERDPRVTLLVIDPMDTSRYIELRGVAALTEACAVEHLDMLTRKYTAYDRFYGNIYPLEKQALETRIICQIEPTKITLDAIHR